MTENTASPHGELADALGLAGMALAGDPNVTERDALTRLAAAARAAIWAHRPSPAGRTEITAAGPFGEFTADAYTVEQAITRLLPASPDDLRGWYAANVDDRADLRCTCVSELLVMIAARRGDALQPGSPAAPWKQHSRPAVTSAGQRPAR